MLACNNARFLLTETSADNPLHTLNNLHCYRIRGVAFGCSEVKQLTLTPPTNVDKYSGGAKMSFSLSGYGDFRIKECYYQFY